MSAFAQRLAVKVEEWIQLRQSLGYAFQNQAATLRALCRFAEAGEYAGPLTQDLALAFVLDRDVTPNVRAQRHGVVRRFADYLSIFEPRTHALDSHALPRCRAIPPVRILDDDELSRLLIAARELSPRFPLRGQTLYTLLGLLASTGLRSGEALRLDRRDVDLVHGVLQIRCTKFRKDRLVPLHTSTRDALMGYAATRERAFPSGDCDAFFLSLRGRRLSPAGLSSVFHQARARAGFDTATPRPLHPHDLRHRFAVTRLVTWHRQGIDVQTRLPLLATYLGHVRYSDTAYYVTATPELLGLAAQRTFSGEGGGS